MKIYLIPAIFLIKNKPYVLMNDNSILKSDNRVVAYAFFDLGLLFSSLQSFISLYVKSL